LVTAVVEGPSDAAVARRILEEAGLEAGIIHEAGGKGRLDLRLRGYNQAARFARWFVLRDLNSDAACAPDLIRAVLPEAAPHMCFRVAVRAVEAWLLADAERLSRFLAVPAAIVPRDPERLEDPKRELVRLARRSRRRLVREAMVPEEGTTALVGPGYTASILELVGREWRPPVAAESSPSLAACLRRLRRWVNVEE
jgi:hypothetical protein